MKLNDFLKSRLHILDGKYSALSEEELNKIIILCLEKGYNEQQTTAVVRELGELRVGAILFEGVLNEELDFHLDEDGNVVYGFASVVEIPFMKKDIIH